MSAFPSRLCAIHCGIGLQTTLDSQSPNKHGSLNVLFEGVQMPQGLLETHAVPDPVPSRGIDLLVIGSTRNDSDADTLVQF